MDLVKLGNRFQHTAWLPIDRQPIDVKKTENASSVQMIMTFEINLLSVHLAFKKTVCLSLGVSNM